MGLFHVFEPTYRGFAHDSADYDRQFETTSLDQCRDFLREVAGKEAIAKFDVVAGRGDPVMGLQLLTNDADTDLVIVGTRGRTGLLHALVGSVASRIMGAVPCDILAVPSRQR